jgi:hypothetical protein
MSGVVPLLLVYAFMASTQKTLTFIFVIVDLHVIDNTKAHSKDHMDHTKYDGELHFV